MELTVLNGLPAHVLLVHVVVVLVPLTAIALVVSAVRPSWIRRLGIVLPLLALVTLVSIPLTTGAGEWLEKHTDRDPLVRRHAELGDALLPWVVGLFVLAAALWWLGRRASAASSVSASVDQGADREVDQAANRRGVALSTPVRIVAVVLSLVVAAGSVVQVYRIGDSGAKAAWHDGYSAKPVSADKD